MHHVCLSGMYMIKQKTIQTIIQIKNIWIEQRQIVRACKYENCHRGKFIHLSQISLFIRPKSAIKREKFLSNLYNNRIFQRNELLLTPLSCQMRGFLCFSFILTDHTCHQHCRPFPSVKDYRLQCIRISLSPPWPLFGNIFWQHCSGASPFSNLYLRNLTAKKARLQSMQQIFYRKRNFGISYKNTLTEEDVHASVHNTARPFSCKSFQETFKRSQGLRIHVTSHTLPRITCDFCDNICCWEHI